MAPISLLIEEADRFCLIPMGHASSLLPRLAETFTLGFKRTDFLHTHLRVVVGSSAQASHLMNHSAMDDSIGGSNGVTGLRVQRTAHPYESELLDLRPTLARYV